MQPNDLTKEPLSSQVFSYIEHMGDRGFTQRDLHTDLFRGYGRLEPRNVVRNCTQYNIQLFVSNILDNIF